jgi:hypothetical protein
VRDRDFLYDVNKNEAFVPRMVESQEFQVAL